MDMTEERLAHLRAIASKGGRATAERYGPEHMRSIGRTGFETIAARYGEINAIRWLGNGRTGFTKRPRAQWDSSKPAITAWDKDARRVYEGAD